MKKNIYEYEKVKKKYVVYTHNFSFILKWIKCCIFKKYSTLRIYYVTMTVYN